MATIYEVSKLAGVSLATVSRVMNGTAKVSTNTQKKVREAMLTLGYTPNSVAISLASKRSNCVGILVAELGGLFFGDMMSGIESQLRARNKHVVITASHGRLKDEEDGIKFLISRNCDAIVVHAEKLSDDYLIELSKGKTPIYILNRFIPELAERCVSLDNVQGGYLAAKYVLEQGHREVAIIVGPGYKKDAVQRLEGCKKAFAEMQVELPEANVYEGTFLEDSGAEGVDAFIQAKLSFSALICGNDQMAIGAMARLRDHGLIPAKDVAIIGFDDVKFASCTYPRLTTIKYPVWDMGKMTANLLLKQVYNLDKEVISRSFEPTLIVRDSVHKLP